MKTSAQKRTQQKETAKNVALLRKRPLTNTMAEAALVPADKPLTDMQRDFVVAWAQGDTIPNAMARAGYNEQPSYGYRMAKMPNILARYNAEKALYEEASQMTRKKVMDGLLEAVEMAKLMAEPATMVSGWREIGRMCGYYEPAKQKIEINVTGNLLMDRMNRLTDAELLRVIAEGAMSGLPPTHPTLQGENEDDE